MSWRSESPFTVGFRAYVGFWFHCSPNPWYLREKADADDMKVAAVSLIGPLLPVLYNCTPGLPPKFAP